MKFSTYCLLLSTIVPVAFPLNGYSKVSVKSSPVDHYSRSKSLNQKNFINKSTKNSNSPHSKTNHIIDTREITEIPDEIEIIKKPDITETPEEMEIIEPDESNKGPVDIREITDPFETAPVENVVDRNAIYAGVDRRMIADEIAAEWKLQTMPYDDLIKLQHTLIVLVPFFQSNATLMNFHQPKGRSNVTFQDVNNCLFPLLDIMVKNNNIVEKGKSEDAKKKLQKIKKEFETSTGFVTFHNDIVNDKEKNSLEEYQIMIDPKVLENIKKLKEMKDILRDMPISPLSTKSHENLKTALNFLNIRLRFTEDAVNETVRKRYDPARSVVLENNTELKADGQKNYNYYDMSDDKIEEAQKRLKKRETLAKNVAENKKLKEIWKKLTNTGSNLSINIDYILEQQIKLGKNIKEFLTSLSRTIKELKNIKIMSNDVLEILNTLETKKIQPEINKITSLDIKVNSIETDLKVVKLKKMKEWGKDGSRKITPSMVKTQELYIQELKESLELIKIEGITQELNKLVKKLDECIRNNKDPLKSRLDELKRKSKGLKLKSKTAKTLEEKIKILNKIAQLHIEVENSKYKSSEKETQETQSQLKKPNISKTQINTKTSSSKLQKKRSTGSKNSSYSTRNSRK